MKMNGERTNDSELMRRVLRLARRGRTSPNPMVGAVIVRDGEIVGEGYHPRAGEPHAEVFALRTAGFKARGAALYVNLEPCCHVGRTPPCTRAIIDAGIKTVVVGMVDPDTNVSGKGLAELRNAGIEVRCPVCEDTARQLNEFYIKHRTTGLPFVILKSAMSLDGKIATHTGDSKWITGERARAYAHRLRNRVDAILIGGRTARIDNPALTARLPSRTHYPTRIILTQSGKIPADLEMFKQPGESIVACSERADSKALRKLAEAGARILTLRESGGRLLFADLFRNLGKMGYLSVLIEGGGEAAAAALEERMVDKVAFFYAPRIIGGRDAASAVAGIGVSNVDSSIHLDDLKIRRLGDDFLVEAHPVYN